MLLPIVKMSLNAFAPLIAKVNRQLSGWKALLLNHVGRTAHSLFLQNKKKKVCLWLTQVIGKSPSLRWFCRLFHPNLVKQKIEWNRKLPHPKNITIRSQNQWYEKRTQNKKYWIAKISNLNELAEGSLVILGLLLSTCPTMKEDGWDWVTNQKFKG